MIRQLLWKIAAAALFAFVLPNPSFADVPEEPHVNLRSLFYDFTLMAETGVGFTSLGDAPSINRSGTVAFQAQNASGQGVWSSDSLSTIDLTPGFDGPSRAFGRAVMLSDAGDAIESDRATGSPPPTFIRIWPGTGSGAFTTLGRGGASQPYDAVLSHPTLSANGNAWAFTAFAPGSTITMLVTPLGETQLLGNQGTGYRPMVADDRTVVLRDSNTALRQIKVFRGGDPNNFDVAAGGSDGFTQLGNQPGISDSGKIIAFSGDRGSGPGVFIAYELIPGAWIIERVAGEGAAVQGNQPDLGFDENDNPIFFSGIDFNSRVAVMHQERGPAGLEGDTVVVAFIGTPNGSSEYPRFGNYPGLFFRQALGLWTVRLDFRLDSALILQLRKRYAVPVAQIGDTIAGGGISDFVVANLAIHDPLAEATTDDLAQTLQHPAGSHRVAFWASNSGGKQVILRGTHVNSCLLAVRHFSQCDSRWETKPYVATGQDFCAKACALTSQTMAANYGADFYDIDDFETPAEVHDFIRPRGGFSGNGVHWFRSIQALRQAPGLLSLQPNTLRFVPNRISVLPTSSLARVNAAFGYIDGSLCDDDNPAPVVLGADRERNEANILVPGHYILASGRVNDRRFISDPGYMNGILFSQGTTTTNPISTQYQRNFVTRGVVVDPVELGGMTISVGGDASLLVTDNFGRRAGFVADSEEPLEEIPEGTFFFDGLRNIETQGPVEDMSSSFLTATPGTAPYTVRVIGIRPGSFMLAVDLIGSDGSLTLPVSLTDAIAPSQVKTYVVTPGSGGVTVVPAGGPVCGNSSLESGEQCDDGNTVSGDGCSATCQIEDACPGDPDKTTPGICGCGVPDIDTDSDGTLDCNDQCSADPAKVSPGVCGCGVADTDSDGDGVPNCNDQCPADASKTNPGACGCGIADTDTDGDGTPNCTDQCPADPAKVTPGVCGCGIADTDSDGDGVPNCQDNCPAVANPSQTDSNGDGIGDACDTPEPVCGNNTVEGSEQCDDGNTTNTDSCKNNCTLNVCGDGVIRTGVEQCDDGNTTSGDGCSASCQTEAPLDTIAPSCVLTTILPGPPTQVIVTTQDTGSGLASITPVIATNATVNIPPFSLGYKDPLVITATKIDQSKKAQVMLEVKDVAGNTTSCDPVLTLLVRENGKPVTETLTDIPEIESQLTVLNGSPGIKNLLVTVNGVAFRLNGLKDGEKRSFDVSSAMRPGNTNTITLTAWGKPGSQATVVIAE